jgi:putative Mg2+ transporter-C (MgtC) family protein
MVTDTPGALVRLLVAFALTFVIGYERELRGSPAGDRTFSLIGVGSALIGVLASRGAPNALAGVVTGIGFIGGGIVFRQAVTGGEVVRGVTSAATIFATAAIGAAAGEGWLLLAAVGTAFVLFSLEVRNLPIFRLLDARIAAHRFKEDETPPVVRGPGANP